jgi:hypothetical protein
VQPAHPVPQPHEPPQLHEQLQEHPPHPHDPVIVIPVKLHSQVLIQFAKGEVTLW